MGYDVFVSYSSHDKAVADAIVAGLERQDFRCWYAPRDVAPGADWGTSITEAINQCRIVLLIFSNHANQSKRVLDEIYYAISEEKTIIPFRIENLDPTGAMRLHLSSRHWLDAFHPSWQAHIERLISSVASSLGRTQGLSFAQEDAPAVVQSFSQPVEKRSRQRAWRWIGLAIALLAVLGGSVTWWLYNRAQGEEQAESKPTEQPLVESTSVFTPEGQPKTITIWYASTFTQAPMLDEIFNDYMKDHPGVRIILSDSRFSDDIAGISDFLRSVVPSGKGPDIVIIPASNQMGDLLEFIVSLDPYGFTKNWLVNNYEPVAVDKVFYKGQVWAVPINMMGLAMVYNKALIGPEDFPSNPQDFSALLAQMEQHHAEGNDFELFCVQDMISAGSAFMLAPLFFGFNVPAYVDDQGLVYLQTSQAEDALEWLISAKPYLPYAQPGECLDAMVQGRVGAMWTGHWFLPQFEEAGIQYGVLPMGRPYVASDNIALTTNAVDRQNDDIAVDIIRYYTSVEVQKKIFVSLKAKALVPAISVLLEDREIMSDEVIAGFAAALRLGVAHQTSSYSDVQWQPIADAIQAAWDEELSPAEALMQAQKTLEAEIALIQQKE